MELDLEGIQRRLDACLDVSEKELIHLADNTLINTETLTLKDIASLLMSWQIMSEFQNDVIALLREERVGEVLDLVSSIADSIVWNNSTLNKLAGRFADLYVEALRCAAEMPGDGWCLDLSRVLWRGYSRP